MTTATFDRLSGEAWFKELFQHAKHHDYPKNHIIMSEGTPSDCLYLLVSGIAAVRHSGPHSDLELLLAYLYSGDFFGEVCLFPGLEPHCAVVQTRAPCVVLEIGHLDFMNLAQHHPSLWLELAGQLATRLRSANHRLASMPALHAADRVWLALTEIASHSDSALVLPEGRPVRISRQDLGKLAGCSRELAGMLINDFAHAGRISLRGKTIIMPNRAAVA
jgi:CRP/FNR family cyclic AMP-dependent transcriptional regulator